MSATDRFARVIAAIDAANAVDPNTLEVEGVARPKELVHAEMASAWIERLRPDASEALRIAARGHHLRRWLTPRSTYPTGRSGYLRWRRDLHRQHAIDLAEIMATCGYDETTTHRTQQIVRKAGLGHDDEVQAFEDALCLVFLETQLADVADRLEHDKLRRVLARTAAKMSREGRAAARALALPGEAARVVADVLDELDDG